MKYPLTLLSLWLSVFLFSSGTSFGDEQVKNLPGYVDFSLLGEFQDSKESVEVTIKAPLLSIIAKTARKEDPTLSNLLSGLKLIQVYTFSLKGPGGEAIKEQADKITLDLQKKGWERIVRVKEPGEKVEIYIKTVGGEIAGLVVSAVENKEEVAFVNIVGKINLDSLDKLSSQFNLPGLDSLKAKAVGER